MAMLQSDFLMSGVQSITCFYFALSSNHIPRYWECSQSGDWTLRLPSNQILWRWQFSQSRVSTMEIQPWGLHESGNWGNQAFSRSNSRPIRFGKDEKSEFTSHFSKFVIIGITLGKDCFKKMVIVYTSGVTRGGAGEAEPHHRSS